LYLNAARVVTDRVTGFSKGFGFVKYATVEDATRGIEGMDGKVRFLIIPTVPFLWISQCLDLPVFSLLGLMVL
jgi:RNA recognition motif-containing protein